MELQNKNIGFAMTASFYHIGNMIEQIKQIKDLGANIIPIMSFNAYHLNTRIGNSSDYISKIESITNKKVICTIQEAEELGIHDTLDILIISPATRE